ncbi:MAG: tRNA (guanine-N1)-methyltransferase [Archaeoglobaceae archaeon]|nr:tRNA (guanine-N1)-methyltransferase [Archaeoglobaceae archaeon]MCX8152190.1 tRNA (guanine-N1)-methyltransferase [Archaeoglobaceae archaeon]MDW8013906.1 tRNA (guanine-N1)-methyltransferase [Archaeoglobaceae archaeon]
MRLLDLFIQILKEKGIRGIGVNFETDLEEIALKVANGEFFLSECKDYRSIVPVECEVADVCLSKKREVDEKIAVSKEDVVSRDNFPYIAIDCRFYEMHSEKEKRSLKKQIEQTLGSIRRFLWDDKLIIAGKNFGIGKYYERLEDFLIEKGIKEVVLLDPYAEEVFKGEKARCYVVGGIVDKGEEKVLTPLIGKALRDSNFEVLSRKIELRGDKIGVPDRINQIVEILLRVVCDGEDVERAVRIVQPRVVARWRLRKELSKVSFRVLVGDKVFRAVKRSDLKIFDWLNVNEEDFYYVARELRFFVVSDEFFKLLKWNDERRSYSIN